MGNHANITATKFPKQGRHLGDRCAVVFHYDTSTQIGGIVVRDDAEEPYETIIHLDDGHFVRSAECQYSPEPKKAR